LQHWGRTLLAAGEPARAIEKFDAAIEIYRSRGASVRLIEYMMVDKMRAQDSKTTTTEVKFPPTASVNANLLAGTHQLQAASIDDRTSNDRIRGDRDVSNVFHCEGDYWTVAYESQTWRLKDAKGLHYLAYLLGHPGEEIRVLDLA